MNVVFPATKEYWNLRLFVHPSYYRVVINAINISEVVISPRTILPDCPTLWLLTKYNFRYHKISLTVFPSFSQVCIENTQMMIPFLYLLHLILSTLPGSVKPLILKNKMISDVDEISSFFVKYCIKFLTLSFKYFSVYLLQPKHFPINEKWEKLYRYW